MTIRIIRKLDILKKSFNVEIKLVKSINEINIVQSKYIGQESFIFYALKNISTFPLHQRQYMGFSLNTIYNHMKGEIKKKNIKKVNKSGLNKSNLSIPLKNRKVGNFHPIIKTCELIIHSLTALGFNLVSGPEIDHIFYNFDKLNIKHDHLSRNITDTFYIKKNVALRTHTSSVQIRILSAFKKFYPIRVISYGKVYRKDSDRTHSPMFNQLEGLYIGKHISFSDLKGTLTEFIHKFFEKKVNIRWRSSHFPFTEPSCEIDVQCFKCKGKKCYLCNNCGWIEIMGAGMVNPIVLNKIGINPKKYNGFAFGLGIERFSMVYYELNDIKSFFDNILQTIYTF